MRRRERKSIMKRNPFIRSIASVLTAAMLLSMTPDLLSAKAEEPPEPPQETVYADYEKPPVEQYILSEDVSRRTENEKHFLLSDGSYQLSSYQDNVHYKDEEGNWQEIDNSLEYKPVGGQENIEGYDFYQNKANRTVPAGRADRERGEDNDPRGRRGRRRVLRTVGGLLQSDICRCGTIYGSGIQGAADRCQREHPSGANTR